MAQLGGSSVGHKKGIVAPAFADPGRTSRLREANTVRLLLYLPSLCYQQVAVTYLPVAFLNKYVSAIYYSHSLILIS